MCMLAQATDIFYFFLTFILSNLKTYQNTGIEGSLERQLSISQIIGVIVNTPRACS